MKKSLKYHNITEERFNNIKEAIEREIPRKMISLYFEVGLATISAIHKQPDFAAYKEMRRQLKEAWRAREAAKQNHQSAPFPAQALENQDPAIEPGKIFNLTDTEAKIIHVNHTVDEIKNCVLELVEQVAELNKKLDKQTAKVSLFGHK